MEPIALNGRSYRRPARPTAVICADGCDPAYLKAGIAAGVLPAIAGFRAHGFYGLADAAMPTFTNPNNISIVTGVSPSVHGISGNFALDRASGAEVMMTDPAMVRTPTLLALLSQAGVAPAELARAVRGMAGVDQVLERDAAAAEYELPWDREADLVVTGDANTVLGASAAEHDLSALAGHRLRSHGGRAEQLVPFLLSHPLNAGYRNRANSRLRNFDIFDFALNGVDA